MKYKYTFDLSWAEDENGDPFIFNTDYIDGYIEICLNEKETIAVQDKRSKNFFTNLDYDNYDISVEFDKNKSPQLNIICSKKFESTPRLYARFERGGPSDRFVQNFYRVPLYEPLKLKGKKLRKIWS